MATKPIEIVIPAGNSAAEWNAAIKEGAEKAGLPLPVPGATAAPIIPATVPDKKDEPVLYRAKLTVGDKELVFEDLSAENVLKQYTAAVEAAHLAPTPAAAAVTKPEVKPAFTEAELFDISLGFQTGNLKSVETFIEKSGMLDRWMESKGIKVEDLKAATTARQSDSLADKWKEATDAFTAKVKAGQSDYPGGEQNTYLMGLMLAELGLREKPSVESFEAAYSKLKERNLVFPVAKTDPAAAEVIPPTKQAPSSTAVGSTGGQEVRGQAKPTTGTVELDITQISLRQATESYNQLIQMGYKPEQIKIKQ